MPGRRGPDEDLWRMPSVRRRLLPSLACFVLAATGCGGPVEPLGSELAPRAEALAFFPPTSPAVAVVSTKGAGVATVAGGLLRAAGRPLRVEDLRPVLGREVVLGIPRPGAAPIAVAVAPDAGAPARVAAALVTDGRATPAGRYRGADLFAADGIALASRDGVLVVAPRTADLRGALDQRAEGEGLDEPTWRLGLPRGGAGPGTVARATFDTRVLLARASSRVRAIPWLSAAGRLGVTVRATPGGAIADIGLDTRGEDLVERDVPISPGRTAPLAIAAGGATLSVRDLAHVLGVGREAFEAAAPIEFLRYLRGRSELARRRGIDVEQGVIGRLHGPATLIRDDDGWAVVARPSRPGPLRAALDRVAGRAVRALARGGIDGTEITSADGLHVVRRDGEMAFGFGLVGDVFVAGTFEPDRLAALGRVRAVRAAGARGGLSFTVDGAALGELVPPALAPLLSGARVEGWLRGEPLRTTGRVTLTF